MPLVSPSEPIMKESLNNRERKKRLKRRSSEALRSCGNLARAGAAANLQSTPPGTSCPGPLRYPTFSIFHDFQEVGAQLPSERRAERLFSKPVVAAARSGPPKPKPLPQLWTQEALFSFPLLKAQLMPAQPERAACLTSLGFWRPRSLEAPANLSHKISLRSLGLRRD